MKSSIQISRGIEALFGTRDENIRLIESELALRTYIFSMATPSNWRAMSIKYVEPSAFWKTMQD